MTDASRGALRPKPVFVSLPSTPNANASAPASIQTPALSSKDALVRQVSKNSLTQSEPAQKSVPISAAHHVTTKEGILPEGRAGRTLNKLETFILSVLMLFSSTIGKYFVGRIFEHLNHEIHIRNEIQKTLDNTKAYKSTYSYTDFATYEANPNKATTLLKVPKELRSDAAALSHISKLKGKIGDRTEIAKKAVEANVHTNIEDTYVNNVGIMVPYRFERTQDSTDTTIVPNEITPTSFRLGKKGAKDSLTNVYVIKVDGKEYGIIRSGVINTKERADDFVALLKDMRSKIVEETENDNFNMRVLSHQLNSYENEGSDLIKPQHAWMAYANEQMRGLGEVVHIDTSSNSFYTYATKHPSTLGKIFWGERATKEMNADSWGTYVKWVAEDIHITKIIEKTKEEEREVIAQLFNADPFILRPLPSAGEFLAPEACRERITKSLATMADMPAKKRELNNLKSELQSKKKLLDEKVRHSVPETQRELQDEIIDHLKADITSLQAQYTTLKDEIANVGKTLKQARKEMQGHLKADYAHLKKLEKSLNDLKKIAMAREGDPQSVYKAWAPQKVVLDDFLQKVSLMKQILGSQLGMPGEILDRGKEGMAIQLLNMKLGVTSALNCSSGLNRTGPWHAIRVSMEELVQARRGDTDTLFTMIDTWEETTKEMNEMIAKKNGESNFRKWLEVSPHDHRLLKDKKNKMIEVVEFRKLVLKHLLTLGLDPSQASELFKGMRWHMGTWRENTIPLNFLPPSVLIGEDEVPLVDYRDGGHNLRITELGKELIGKAG